MLILKDSEGKQLALKPGESHTFKREEYSKFRKSCEGFKRNAWLEISEVKEEKPEVVKPPVEPPAPAPVVDEKPEVVETPEAPEVVEPPEEEDSLDELDEVLNDTEGEEGATEEPAKPEQRSRKRKVRPTP